MEQLNEEEVAKASEYKTFKDFIEEYKPKESPFAIGLDKGFIVDNYHTPEAEKYLKENAGKDNCKLWTVISNDEDGEWCITEGWHFVNRVGYIVCEVPREERLPDEEEETYKF